LCLHLTLLFIYTTNTTNIYTLSLHDALPILKVDENTYTPDIADKLIDKKIIDKDEGDKFIEYIEDNDYSDYIQLGTFKVDSEMSMKDLAETFTTYPGD